MKVVMIEETDFKQIINKIDGIETRMLEMAKKAYSPLSERWLDNQEVCDLMKISKRTLQTYRDEKKLPYSQINHKLYYRASDIDRLLNSCMTKYPTFLK